MRFSRRDAAAPLCMRSAISSSVYRRRLGVEAALFRVPPLGAALRGRGRPTEAAPVPFAAVGDAALDGVDSPLLDTFSTGG